IRKLALYAHGKASVDLDDVLAVVADASSLALDAAVDAAFAGNSAEAETQFAKVCAAGTSPSAILWAAQRQVAQLHRARLTIEDGSNIDEVVESLRLHFSRKRLVRTALSAWTSQRLERIMTRFAEASLDARQRPTLAEVVAQRALMAAAEMV